MYGQVESVMSVAFLNRQQLASRVFKNRWKYYLKSNQIICRKNYLKLQSNSHFPKQFKIKIKSNRFTKWQIILVFLGRL
jgi:hypothetical protein